MGLLPGEWEATFHFTIQGADGDVQVVWGGPETTDPLGLPADLVAAWIARFSPQQSTACTFTGVTVHIGQDGGEDTVTEFSASQAGSKSGDAYAPNVAALITKNTGLSGRKNRGRMFFPGLSEAQVGTGGILNTADRTNLQAAASGFVGDLLTGGHTSGVLHKAVNQPEVVIPAVVRAAEPGTPLAFANEVVVAQKLATQRRRLRD